MATATPVTRTAGENPKKTGTDQDSPAVLPVLNASSGADPRKTLSSNGVNDNDADSKKTILQSKTSAELPTAKNVKEPISDTQKKMLRAERFGVPVLLTEREKLSSRAERFGTGSRFHDPDSSKSEDNKRKARAERFGMAGNKESSDEEAKKMARLARFGSGSNISNVEEDKRKARAIRFSSTQPNSSEKETVAKV